MRTKIFGLAALALLLAPTTALAAPAWKLLGPAPLDVSKGPLETPNMGPTAGRASSLAIDPTDSSVLYAGFAQGGVWKSTDGGASWTPRFDDQPTLAVGSIAIDPASHDVWVGTGEAAPYAGRAGEGLYVSSDGGATWAKRGGDTFDGKAIAKILFDGPDVYVAVTFSGEGRGEPCTNTYSDAAGQGLYRSSDGGATFTLLKSGSMIDVEVDASITPHPIFASDFAAGAFRSTDGGATWQPISGLPTGPNAKRIELTLSPANPAYVYAGLQLGSASKIYVSSDHGVTFAEMPGAPDYCEAQCYYDNAVLADPTDPAKVYLGGSLCGIWGSTDATSATPAWTNVSALNQDCGMNDANWYLGYVHPDVHSLTIDPSNPSFVYTLSDGGIGRSKDGGATWERLNAGIGTIQLYGICVDPNDPSVVYAGSQDNGIMKSAAGSLTWRGISEGDGGPCAVDAGDSKIVLSSIAGAAIFRSANAFASPPTAPVFDADPSTCTSEPGCGDRSAFIAPLVGDPVSPHTFYVGTYRLWKSDQGGTTASWKAISPDLTAGPGGLACTFGVQSDDVLSAIAPARSDASTIYTGSQGGVLERTTDGGATWTKVSKAPLPARYVSGIAVDPYDAKRVYAAFSGFSKDTPATPGHVFASIDGGETWSAADTPGDEPIDSLLAHPAGPGLLYAGTESGVLYTEDAGKTWQPLDAMLGGGLPHTAVYALAFHDKSSTLYAGTHGRSIWSVTFPDADVDATPASLTFKAKLGDPDPAPQTILAHATEPLGSTVPFVANANEAWITGFPFASSAAGTEGTQVVVTVSIAGLDAGSYDGKVVLTGRTHDAVVPVHLEITNGTPTPAPPVGYAEIAGGSCVCSASTRRDAPSGVVALGVAVVALARRRLTRSAARRRPACRP